MAVYDRYGIDNMYFRVGGDMDDVEAGAYYDASAYMKSKYFGVQMSLCAPILDRDKSMLEFEDVGSVRMHYCADIIVFKDFESWVSWDRGDFTIWSNMQSGVQVRDNKSGINIKKQAV